MNGPMPAVDDIDLGDIEIRQDGSDEVMCAGCAQPGNIEIVIGNGKVLAWHTDCLHRYAYLLPAPFTGTWEELSSVLEELDETDGGYLEWPRSSWPRRVLAWLGAG